MNRAFRRLTALAAVIFFGAAGAGPSVGSGLLLESDTNGTSFFLLETSNFLLLEEGAGAADGPASGSGLVFESASTDFLLLETGDFLLLEE